MTDERYTFEQAKLRLEEIATLARKKDTSLEKSLDLLEEGVRLANICTELVDHTDLSATAAVPDEAEGQSPEVPDVAVAEDVGDGRAGARKTPEGDDPVGDDALADRDDDMDEPAGMDEPIDDVEGGATEEYEGLDA